MKKELIKFYKLTLNKSFAVFGFALFSTLTALQLTGIQNLTAVITASFIASGLYFFTELIKYFQIQPQNKINYKGKKHYNFII